MEFFKKNQALIKKIKNFFKDYIFIYYLSLIILPLSAYFIGKKNAFEIKNPDIIIDTKKIDCNCPKIEPGKLKIQTKSNIQSNSTSKSKEKKFVASKNGTKYYTLDCGGVNRIKDENKVYYSSEKEAQADGKTFSATCSK
ncbi:MAG: hypothetical protein GF335_04980 [Candidatus Moranbacteria bacterium]|nr:hypothetical protein [Candidatus Moranbacteria bacterium]